MAIDKSEVDVRLLREFNDPSITWQFLKNDIPEDQIPVTNDLMDLTGSVLTLKIIWGTNTIIEKDSETNNTVMAIDIPNAKLKFTFTQAETELLPIGRIARYQVARTFGSHRGRLAGGYIIVSDGF